MSSWKPEKLYTQDRFKTEAGDVLQLIKNKDSVEKARLRIIDWICQNDLYLDSKKSNMLPGNRVLVRDCTRALYGMVKPWSEKRSGFSLTKALWDIARGQARPDLQPGFYAEMIHLFRGIMGRPSYQAPSIVEVENDQSDASQLRSRQLDVLWNAAESRMAKYSSGLDEALVLQREQRKEQILKTLGGVAEQWNDWKWQVNHIVKEVDLMKKVVGLSEEEIASMSRARKCRLPFGVTPYYASLMDEHPSGRDMGIRAQVLPPMSYVQKMEEHSHDRKAKFDFMGESDTSPIDLITRRYPSILILKPFNTCPQICVYCQRNWEIDEAMAPDALAENEKLEEAIGWIERHPAVHEVLVTGGDPLALDDQQLDWILGRLAAIPSLDVIRIGSRTLVTMPMRITQKLADLIGKYRVPGKREVCLMTHVQHAGEITPQMLMAVDRLRRQGISIFNQHVYTFHVSRRFETASLRMLLRRVGINPYYTFVTKGKEETDAYRVPIARLLQEQKEEARLLPGVRRTDEVVYNVPRLGKNYIRAYQHRDLLAVLPEGRRVYEFHPWEKHVVQRDSYVSDDVSILNYLTRLVGIGEDPEDYQSIWYYY